MNRLQTNFREHSIISDTSKVTWENNIELRRLSVGDAPKLSKFFF